MKFLRDLPYETLIPIDNKLNFNGLNQSIYLTKTYAPGEKRDVYHLKTFITLEDGSIVTQGYLYFYISFTTCQSKFCGIFIRPEYRNNDLASLLISSWIKLCLDNDISCLNTIKKQRKPFLICLLKTYSFELNRISLYYTDKKSIIVCKSSYDSFKYLLFKDTGFRDEFSKSDIMAHDSYRIIDSMSDDYTILDKVVLSRRYDMQDSEQAYSMALSIYKKHQL